MGTTYKNFSKLTAGVSTRADLISYFNANMDAIDALLQNIYASSGHTGIGGTSSYPLHVISCADAHYGAPDLKRLLVLENTITIGVGEVGLQLRNNHTSRFPGAWDIYTNAYSGDIRFAFAIGADPTILGTDLLTLNQDGTLWVANGCSALSFIDRTPAFAGNALAAIAAIRAAEDGEIDHATLPEFAIMPYQDERGEWWPGRSLGDMVSVLTVAIQQLAASYDAAIAERDGKIEALSQRIDELAAKLQA